MKKSTFLIFLIIALLYVLVSGCSLFTGSNDRSDSTFKIIYHNNGADSGFAPEDTKTYTTGESAIIRNQNTLIRSDHVFACWNLVPDCSGTDFLAGSEYKFGDNDLNLYANWINAEKVFLYTICFDANGADSGIVPDDMIKVAGYDLVIPGAGSLVKTEFDFAGWNTKADGSGYTFTAGSLDSLDESLILYADWTDGTPGKVSGLTASPGALSLRLSWTDPTDDDLSSCEISWTPEDGESQPVTVVPGEQTYLISGLEKNTGYNVTIICQDDSSYTSDPINTTATTLSALFSDSSIINTSAVGAFSVFAADLDGDGDDDVLSASNDDNSIVWYENTDGDGNFSSNNDISTSANGAHSVFAADLDDDGDNDILSASFNDNRIVWYENIDGTGGFSGGTDINSSSVAACSVFASDLDGDGDTDVLSASSGDNRIAWYENSDGAGSFSVGSSITTSALGVNLIFAADLDGDGDTDVLSASGLDDRIAWYENTDGAGTFSAGTDITSSVDGATAVFAGDLDGDGDADILSSSTYDDRIVWYENTDGAGTFSAGTDITSTADGAHSVFATDLDGDGDADVLSASSEDDRIVWYENTDGAGTFSAGTDITSSADGAYSVYAADLDGDGDTDVLSASFNDDRIVWYENLQIP